MKNYKQVLNKLAELLRLAQAATLIDVSQKCVTPSRLHRSRYFVFYMQPLQGQYVLNVYVSCGQLPVAWPRPFISDFWLPSASAVCDCTGMLLLWPQPNQLPVEPFWPLPLFNLHPGVPHSSCCHSAITCRPDLYFHTVYIYIFFEVPILESVHSRQMQPSQYLLNQPIII